MVWLSDKRLEFAAGTQAPSLSVADLVVVCDDDVEQDNGSASSFRKLSTQVVDHPKSLLSFARCMNVVFI